MLKGNLNEESGSLTFYYRPTIGMRTFNRSERLASRDVILIPSKIDKVWEFPISTENVGIVTSNIVAGTVVVSGIASVGIKLFQDLILKLNYNI